jgi:hypothetical protein
VIKTMCGSSSVVDRPASFPNRIVNAAAHRIVPASRDNVLVGGAPLLAVWLRRFPQRSELQAPVNDRASGRQSDSDDRRKRRCP